MIVYEVRMELKDNVQQAAWKQVEVDWQGGSSFLGRNVSGGHIQIGDEDGRPGVSPMDLLLLGLAGCTGIDVVSILEKKRQPPKEMKIQVRGKRVDTPPRVYSHIEVTYILWGENLTAEAVERAIKLSEEKYCSASQILKATAELVSSFTILNPGEVYDH
jgi:putative redox protein